MTDATTYLVIGSAGILVIGAFVEKQADKPALNANLVFAGGVVLVGLSVLDNIEPQLSTGFALLIFLALCAKYVPGILETMGYTNGGPGKKIESSTGTGKTTPPNSKAAGSSSQANIVPANTFGSTPDPAGTPSDASPQNSSGIIVA